MPPCSCRILVKNAKNQYDGIRKEQGGIHMKILLKFPIMLITSVVSLLICLCAGLISCSAMVFKIASSLLSIISGAVMITGDVTNGAILFLLAFLVSPMGIPMLMVKLLGGLGSINTFLRSI